MTTGWPARARSGSRSSTASGCSPGAPWTPYTDLLVERLAAAGARVELVEARVTGTGGLMDLAPEGAVAIVPEGWPARDGVELLAVREDLTLPLVVLWPVGAEPAAVRRLRAGL